MTFKTFCYEMWLEYMDECLCYNQMASSYTDWFRQNKWYLKKSYQVKYNTLQQGWVSDWQRFNQ